MNPIDQFPIYKIRKLANALKKNQMYVEALRCYDEAIRLDQENKDHYQSKAIEIVKMNKYSLQIQNECKEDFLCQIGANQLDSKDLISISSNYEKCNEKSNSVNTNQYYNQNIQLNSTDCDLYLSKGEKLEAIGRIDKAIELYIEASQIQKSQLLGKKISQLAEQLTEIWEYDESIFYYNQIIKLYPDIVINYISNAKILMQTSKYYDAIQNLNEAIQRDRLNIDTHHLKVEALVKLDQKFDAIKCCSQVIALDSEYNRINSIYNIKAFKLKELRIFKQAIQCWRIIEDQYIKETNAKKFDYQDLKQN